MDRRIFLLALLSVTCLAGPGGIGVAMAKDGRDSDDDGGSSGSSDNSGKGNGDSDDDDHDDEDDEDEDDDHSGHGSGSSGRSGSGKDRQRLREAVEKGRILPLRDILKKVEQMDEGRVISVDLNLRSSNPYYTFKMQNGPRVRTLKLDASTGRKLNLFGW
jgi:uncharacterized membrane protein YkoI